MRNNKGSRPNVNCESSIILLQQIEKLRILVLYEKDLITETFSFKFKVILPPPLDICLSFVLLFTTFIIVVTQKLVLQQSKNATAKCTETLSPPPSIQYLLSSYKKSLPMSGYAYGLITESHGGWVSITFFLRVYDPLLNNLKGRRLLRVKSLL